MGVPAVNTTARDINVDLADSCNCKCFSFKHRKSTPMFITKSGDAVPFDPRRAADERQAMQLTMVRIMSVLDRVAEETHCNRQGLQTLIEGRLGAKLQVEPPSPTTLQTIDIINAALKEIIT